MKIQGNKVSSIVNQYKDMKTKVNKGKKTVYGSEKIELSSKSKEVSKIAEKIKLMPEIRSKVVDRIKREIENGNYPVDINKIAQSIMNELVI